MIPLHKPLALSDLTGEAGRSARGQSAWAAIAHLDPSIWADVNRLLIRKAITEFCHELLLKPQILGNDGAYSLCELAPRTGNVRYRFRARRLKLEHWLIDPVSIEKTVNGGAAELDGLRFIVEFRDQLGIGEAMLPVYLNEISSILYGHAYKRMYKPHNAEDLARADFQTIEITMTEGHPVFVANSGRLGFSASEYPDFAPEAAQPLSIFWIGVRHEYLTFSGMDGLSYETLVEEELGAGQLAAFNDRLSGLGLKPAEYRFLPVHPWQWDNHMAMGFAPAIANRDIVFVGPSVDKYQPQQSIRTFFNRSNPDKRYVKMALSILNMGFLLNRGLSPEDMATTTAFNEWLRDLLAGDPVLTKVGFSLIHEVATVSYRDPWLEAAIAGDSPHKNSVAALWRENPLALAKSGERLMTMAALLHVDTAGKPLIGSLISGSGQSAESWIEQYLIAYLTPILHCLYAHDLVFMPHGENVVLVIKASRPVRIIMKDLAEEIRILTDGATLPEAVRRNCVPAKGELYLDGIFTDVFDCFFRPMAALLDEHGLLPADRFWDLVAANVANYQAAHPELKAKFIAHDIFAADFARNCINRLQLRDNQNLIEPGNPDRDFVFEGRMQNPIAGGAAGRSRNPGLTRKAMRLVRIYFLGS